MNRSVSPASARRSPAESETGCSSGITRSNSSSCSPVSILLVNISFIAVTSNISGSSRECFLPPDMHQHRLRDRAIDALANARQQHSDGMSRAVVTAIELETVGGLRTARELRHAVPEFLHVLERRHLIKVASFHLRRRDARF